MPKDSPPNTDVAFDWAGPDIELRELADALPVLVAYLEVEGGEVRYRFVNKLYESWFPLSRDAVIGRRVRDVVGEAAYATVSHYVERSMGGERLRFEAFMPYEHAPPRHISVEYVPRFKDGAVVGLFTLVNDITAAKAAEAALRESEEDYRYAAELNPQVAWTALPDGQLDRVAQRWSEWTGTSGLGASYAEGLHPEDVARTIAVWAQSVASGQPYDIVHRVKRTDGEFRWIRSRAYPRRDAAGAIIRWYGSTEDIHEQHVAEEHLKLMVLELNHRVKNNMATVQAIAAQSLRGAETPPAVREAFLQRITALAAAHDILTREHWEGVSIAEVANGVLEPLVDAPGRVVLEGPALRLDTATALALSMAFHELGTNAIKYGALSANAGKVMLRWSVQDGQRFDLSWTEVGGPPVVAPTRQGFGTRLLERGVAGELNGKAKLDYTPGGLIYSLTGRAGLAQA